MKIQDDDLKKAFQNQTIPEPDTSKKDHLIREAGSLFQKNFKQAEKKDQGFSNIVRLMGNFIKKVISTQGEPIMTTQRLATIGMALFALTLALSTPLVIRHKDKSNQDISETITSQPQEEQHIIKSPEPVEHGANPESTVAGNKPATRQIRDEFARTTSPKKQDGLKEYNLGKSKAEKISRPNTMPVAPVFKTREAKVAPQPGMMQSTGNVFMAEQDAQTHYYKDVGRDTFTTIKLNPLKLVKEEPVSTFSIDVDTASYTFARRQLNLGILPQKDAVRIEEMINYFDYDYAVPDDKSAPFGPTVAVYPTPWNQHTKLLHIGIKGYDIVASEKPTSNLVFLLDVSGSMNNPDKLPLLKNSFSLLVNNLAADDTVAIVVHAGAAGTVLEPTKVKDKGKILAALDRLQAGGSTAGGQGIRLAYSLAESNFNKDAVNRVILATDGDFNVGITDREELKSFVERKRKTGIFLSVLGFGQGNYNDALMQTLAQNGNGNAAYIDSLTEARKVLVDEASSTLFTIAKDVKIQVEFNPVLVNDYRLIGYETRLLNREDFNNDAVDAGDVGSGHSVTAIYEITPATSPKKLIDDLRYQDNTVQKEQPLTGEYAFLKIRYKLPQEDTSKLITQPINTQFEHADFSTVPAELQFAAAVAGFGQLLREDPYTHDFTYESVIKIGQTARGSDPFGYRSEFLNLVRLAKSARAM